MWSNRIFLDVKSLFRGQLKVFVSKYFYLSLINITLPLLINNNLEVMQLKIIITEINICWLFNFYHLASTAYLGGYSPSFSFSYWPVIDYSSSFHFKFHQSDNYSFLISSIIALQFWKYTVWVPYLSFSLSFNDWSNTR